MSAEELRYKIGENVEDVRFIYNEKIGSVFPIVNNSVPIFVVCFDDKAKEYLSLDEAMSDEFFDGKSLAEIAENVKVLEEQAK